MYVYKSDNGYIRGLFLKVHLITDDQNKQFMKKNTFRINNILSFKRWRSKSYAVFNTLGREVKILTLAASYFCVIGTTQTFSQIVNDSISRKVDLNEVRITARRSPSLYSEVGRVITIIPKKEISKLPVHSIDGLLRYVAGVDIRQRGPLGIQADVSIRGGSFNQVMILLNGINITDPQTGHFNMNIPVDLESIERIEILQGPGSRVYGPSAFSGAINIVTSEVKQKEIKAKAIAGQYGLYSFGASTALPAKKFRNYISGDFNNSNGYIENTDFKTLHLFYNGKISFGSVNVNVQGGFLNKEFGANAFYTPKYPEQFEHTKTVFTSVSAEAGKKVKVKPALYWRRNQDEFQLFRNEHPEWYKGSNFHLTDVYGGNINVIVPWHWGKTSFGGEIRREQIWSNNIGYPVEDTKPVPGEPCQTFDKFYGRTNNSFFIEHSYSSEKFSVSAGLLINNNSSLDEVLSFFPGIDVSYWANSNIKLFSSVNKALRMPTFTEMFYSGPVNEGNPDLKPEEAVTYEFGVNYLTAFADSRLSLFYRNSWNLIDWGRMEGEEKYVTCNLSDMNSFGVEFSSGVDLRKLFNDEKLFLKKLMLGYMYLYQDKQSIPGYESVYVMDYLKNKLTMGLDMKIVSKLYSTIDLVYQDRNGSYTAYEEQNGEYTPVQVQYEPFVTVDMRIQWLANKYFLYVDIDNVFNKKYYDIGNVLQPGIWVKAGIKIDLVYD